MLRQDNRYVMPPANFPNSMPAATACRNMSRKDRDIGHRGLTQFWRNACVPAGGFPGHAGRICRLRPEAERLFPENPAMDLPGDRNGASRGNREKGSCCQSCRLGTEEVAGGGKPLIPTLP
jgi:primary-amine oxidase